MPKIVKPLTQNQCVNAKPKSKLYKLSDGYGLALWIYPSGVKSWKISFIRPADKKPDTLTIGFFPDISLADARQKRQAVRELLANGENPKIRRSVPPDFLFNTLFERWIERRKNEVSPKYGLQIERAIRANCWDILAGRNVKNIQPFDIVQALRPFELRGKLEYLRRTKTGLSLFFDDLVGQGIITTNPVAAVGKKVFRQPEKQHFAALSPEQLPDLVRFLENRKSEQVVKLAIYWQFLTMTRPQETAGAEWAEIDENREIWTIPPERMKRRRQHIVPLSPMAMDILQKIKQLGGEKYLFHGMKQGQHINPESIRLALQRGGLNTTAHGLRALAATILEEQGFDVRVIDACLSHAKDGGNLTTAAYMRSSFFDERRQALIFLGGKIKECLDFPIIT